jgi:hypothetical protein
LPSATQDSVTAEADYAPSIALRLAYRHARGEAGAGLTAQRRADGRLGQAEPVGGPSLWCGEPREALGEDTARAAGLWANEAADGDLEPHAPAEARQIVESAGVGAAKGAGRRRGGGRQVDSEVLAIKAGTNEAAPFGGAQ